MEDLLRWIVLGVFVLGSIFFIVLLVLSAKSWRVMHILSVLFVFACAATFAVLFAMTTKTYTAWQEVDVKNAEMATKSRDQLNDLLYGEPAAEFSEESLVSLKGQLARELIGRGRVWRNATAGLQGNNMVVNIPPAPETPEGTQPPATVIDPQSPMFVFLEAPLASAADESLNGIMVPVQYMGEFVVESATPSQVVLRPTLVFYDPAAIGNQQLQVVLYEKMPGDNHDPIVQISDPNADPLLVRQILQREVFQLDDSFFNPNDPNFDRALALQAERLLDRYQFDGKSLGEIDNIISQLPNRISSDFVETIAPEEMWLEVEFLQPRTVEVDAPNSGDDATDVRRTAVQRGFYDNKGLAISADLRLGGPVEFKAGDTVLVDKITAEDGYSDNADSRIESWVNEGSVKVNERYFFRTLNDYPVLFRELNLVGYQLDRMLEEEQRQNATMALALEKASSQIMAREDEQSRLNTDITNLQSDVDLAMDHLEKLNALLAARRQKINALFGQTQAMARQKAEFEAGLVKSIDERSEAATSIQ